MPSRHHPFGKDLVPYRHRVAMTGIAMRPLGSRVKVSTIEEGNEGIGYTYDLLRELIGRHPGTHFRLVVGSDILAEEHRWKRFDDVEKMAPLIVVPREGSGDTEGFGLPDVSSSGIRDLLSQGREPGPLLPRGVIDYIRSHRLYSLPPKEPC